MGVIEALADIGPSLFVLSELVPEYDPREARRLAGDLFRSSRKIGLEVRANLQKAVLKEYRELQRQRAKHPQARLEDIVTEYLLRRHSAEPRGPEA